jgi:hypothetical protein
MRAATLLVENKNTFEHIMMPTSVLSETVELKRKGFSSSLPMIFSDMGQKLYLIIQRM